MKTQLSVVCFVEGLVIRIDTLLSEPVSDTCID